MAPTVYNSMNGIIRSKSGFIYENVDVFFVSLQKVLVDAILDLIFDRTHLSLESLAHFRHFLQNMMVVQHFLGLHQFDYVCLDDDPTFACQLLANTFYFLSESGDFKTPGFYAFRFEAPVELNDIFLRFNFARVSCLADQNSSLDKRVH